MCSKGKGFSVELFFFLYEDTLPVSICPRLLLDSSCGLEFLGQMTPLVERDAQWFRQDLQIPAKSNTRILRTTALRSNCAAIRQIQIEILAMPIRNKNRTKAGLWYVSRGYQDLQVSGGPLLNGLIHTSLSIQSERPRLNAFSLPSSRTSTCW